MSDTNVQTVDQNALVDMFPDIAKATTGVQAPLGGKFGMSEDMESNIFPPPAASTTEQTTQVPEVTDTKEVTPPKEGEEQRQEADILNTETPPAPTATPLTDLSGYYQDRLKSGKFVAIEETDEKGNVIPFIPKTAEEYDEVLELQIQHRLSEARKDLEKKWYDTKSPAWKAVSQYAELVDDPTQLIPFLQGVRTIQSVSGIDENDIEGAERIVRIRMEQAGEPENIIKDNIESLKTTDRLVKVAKEYKPMILQQEQQQIAADMRQKQEADRKYNQLMHEIKDGAIKALEQPIFGKQKLKQEEKAAIYDLIGEPEEESQGFGIYSAIDQLFDKRDFETLRQIALFLTKKDAFYNYLGTNVANQTAASLQNKLRLAGEARSSSGNDYNETEGAKPAVNRNQFKTSKFGR